MLKWLIFILLLVGIYYFFFRKDKQDNTNNSESIMLECSKCGTYVASDEVIIKDGKYYCSKDCAQVK